MRRFSRKKLNENVKHKNGDTPTHTSTVSSPRWRLFLGKIRGNLKNCILP